MSFTAFRVSAFDLGREKGKGGRKGAPERTGGGRGAGRGRAREREKKGPLDVDESGFFTFPGSSQVQWRQAGRFEEHI